MVTDRPGFRNLRRGCENGRAAEAVADQKRRRLVGLAQMIRRQNEIRDIGGKRTVGEFAFACTEAGEVEPQNRYSTRRQPRGDAFCGKHVLAAGEAMREQRVGYRITVGKIQRGCKLETIRPGKLKTFVRHVWPPRLIVTAPSSPE